MDLIQILKVKVDGSLPVILGPQTVSLAPNLAGHSDESYLGRLGLVRTSPVLDLLTWEIKLDQEGMMKAGPNQGSFPKESLLGEAEEGCTADEEEQGSVAAPAQPLLDGQHPGSPLLSGPLNLWRHLGLKTLSPHLQDMTIRPLIDAPQNMTARNLGRVLLRVVEKDLVGQDQHDPPGKTNHPASDG